ncbi:hypothetical protein [Caballeronia sp. LjRoot31]|uniref:hypothetical protein n=1 Tax=Caballeronia sp. LjRoot31 TaxID=3342324 RepID=UPI003F4FFEE5
MHAEPLAARLGDSTVFGQSENAQVNNRDDVRKFHGQLGDLTFRKPGRPRSPDVQVCFKDRLCVVELYALQDGSQPPISYKLDRSVANHRKEIIWVKQQPRWPDKVIFSALPSRSRAVIGVIADHPVRRRGELLPQAVADRLPSPDRPSQADASRQR